MVIPLANKDPSGKFNQKSKFRNIDSAELSNLTWSVLFFHICIKSTNSRCLLASLILTWLKQLICRTSTAWVKAAFFDPSRISIQASSEEQMRRPNKAEFALELSWLYKFDSFIFAELVASRTAVLELKKKDSFTFYKILSGSWPGRFGSFC